MPTATHLGRVVELTHGRDLWEFLVCGLEEHGSVAAIAAKAGVSKRTVYRWARLHGIETPRNPGRKRKVRTDVTAA